MIVFDAHAHVHTLEETVLRQEKGLHTMISAGNPEQAGKAFEVAEQYPVHTVTAGLHPWYTARYSPETMGVYMERAPVIGEIGMDSVWCDVPLNVQKKAFIRQLDMAREMKKPVILHTKGCEREIAEIIKRYDLPFIVHWYSGPEKYLQHYLDMDCYFTIGPSVGVDRFVQNVARLAPEDRILFETDGMDAVSWAVGETPVSDLPIVLENSAGITAGIRCADVDILVRQANDNYMRLINS